MYAVADRGDLGFDAVTPDYHRIKDDLADLAHEVDRDALHARQLGQAVVNNPGTGGADHARHHQVDGLELTPRYGRSHGAWRLEEGRQHGGDAGLFRAVADLEIAHDIVDGRAARTAEPGVGIGHGTAAQLAAVHDSHFTKKTTK